jgi:hypothetical protein
LLETDEAGSRARISTGVLKLASGCGIMSKIDNGSLPPLSAGPVRAATFQADAKRYPSVERRPIAQRTGLWRATAVPTTADDAGTLPLRLPNGVSEAKVCATM